MYKLKQYLSMIKFSHSIFALPFACIGFCLGVRYIQSTQSAIAWQLAPLVVLCMVSARSAAMAFNRYLDRDIDALNPRTAVREIPQGIIAPKQALSFTIINCVIFSTATFFINPLCFYLSPVALAVVLGYSYTKRYTPLCHLILGIGLGLAPIGAYVAVTGSFAMLPIWYSMVVIFWVSGFDVLYALQDEAFDRANHLQSIPVLMGTTRALLLSRVLHVIAVTIIIFVGILYSYHAYYWAGAACFIILIIRQHSLVTATNLSRINLAFFTLNGIASMVFATLVCLAIFA